jgi:uncharacterized repeat protein (TIGR02543 family)
MILKSNRHHCIAKVSIFLIMVALIVVMVGCNSTTNPIQYSLTMMADPVAGGTTTPTGTTSYAANTAVNITAVANPGYRFVSWTAPAGGFANATAAVTTFTMPAQNVTVTAHFVAVYALTMAVAPGGSGTATDLTNASPYPAGTVVNIQAVAAVGYQFVNWSAPAGTFGSATAATTTFTMPAQAVTVTANFFLGHLIRDWNDLYAIRDNLGDNYLLMNNLNSTTVGYAGRASPAANGGQGWQPIGTVLATFTGTFDGQGYEIKDLSINRPGEDYVGLFGIVDVGGVIENVEMVDADVTGRTGVGILVGISLGTVGSSSATGSVSGNDYIGGLVGGSDGTVSDSSATGSVSGHDYIGGLVGESWITVDSSYATGSVSGNDYVGGLVGNNPGGTVGSSYATGSVSGHATVGGLVGENDGTVSDSHATGSVSGHDTVGGLVGENWGTVSDSYATGSVDGSDAVGGLVGENDGTVSDSHATGIVTGVGLSVGGLVGLNNNVGTVDRSYATGIVNGGGGSQYVGGLVGANAAGSTVSSSYATGSVSGNLDVGGLVGGNGGTVDKSYATGSVTGDGSSQYVGGLVGGNDVGSTVSESYATGNVIGNLDVGGLVGGNGGTVENSYATIGSVTGGNVVGGLVGGNGVTGSVDRSYSTGFVAPAPVVGGLVGWNLGGPVILSCWDIITSGQPGSAGGVGMPTGVMQTFATFNGVWDISSVPNSSTRDPLHIWNIVDGVTYPFLSWQP